MSDKNIIKIKEDPVIIRMTKQGLPGRSGPQGIPGDDGVTWELVLKMENNPENSTNGTCTMWLYKNGDLNTEIHYAFVQILPFLSASFVPDLNASHTITGNYSFQYTNARCIFVTIYEDDFMQKVLCAASVNYGRSATVSIGTVQQGSTAAVENSGTPLDAVLDFVLPKGDAATIRVIRTDTLPAGSPATVENIGTVNDARLVFGIPNGGGCGAWVTPDPEASDTNMLILDAGCIYTPSVSADGVITWTNNFSADNPPSVRIGINPKGDWSSSAAYSKLDVVRKDGHAYLAKQSVPAGTAVTNTTYWMKMVDAGNAASVSVGNVTLGSDPSVTNSGTSSAAVLDFVIPVSSGYMGANYNSAREAIEISASPNELGGMAFRDAPVIIVTGNISQGSAATFTDIRIDSDAWYVQQILFGTPANVKSDVTWTTNGTNHTVTLSGTFAGVTTAVVILQLG